MITILFIVLKLVGVLSLNWWWVIAAIALDLIKCGCGCGSEGGSCFLSKKKKK